MKSLFILLISTGLLLACKDQTPPRYSSASPEIDSVKTLIKDYEDGNWEGWTGHYADTAQVYHNSTDAISPQQLKEGLQGILANASEYHFDDDDIFYEMVIDDDGEKWVNFWGNWEGTLAANGQQMTVPVHLTLQFVDGKIVEEHGYYDLSKYQAAMQEIKAAEMNDEESMEE